MKLGKLNYQFWNFGTQIVTNKINKLFFQSILFILCINLTNINYQQLEYWLKMIKYSKSNRGGISLVILVGTHSEFLTEEEINEIRSELSIRFPKYFYPQVQEFIPISCKTRSGISTLKKSLRTMGSHSAFSTGPIPRSYVQLHMKIKAIEETDPTFLTYTQYVALANSSNIYSEEDIRDASNFLSLHGTILYFEVPKPIIFLHPKALLEFLDFTINKNDLVLKGIIEAHDAEKALVGTPSTRSKPIFQDLIPTFIQIYLKYKIFYYSNNRGSYLVPSMLSKVRPNFSAVFPSKLPEEENCFGRLFQFQHIPMELMERIQIAVVNLPKYQIVNIWANGILVTHEFFFILIEYFPHSHKLVLELRFKKTHNNEEKIVLSCWRQMLQTVRTSIESWSFNLNCSELIPCIHCIKGGVSRDLSYFIDYQDVLDSSTSLLFCHNIESSSRCVDKIDVAPDISLIDLPQINAKKLIIKQEIGKGAFGVVFKGTFDRNPVAIKELSSDLNHVSGEVFREFQGEIYAQCLLDHPNCVKLYGVTANPPRMILEFISGGDLYHFLHPKVGNPPTQDTLSWERRYNIALDIAKGLYHMQSLNPPIVHRDLRSPNIFLTPEGKALIGDFGLSRLVNTEIAGVLGTWQWCAPECIDSKDSSGYDCRADIYSFGIVLWELASLDYPFEEYASNPLYFQNKCFKLQELKRAIIDYGLRPTIPSSTPPEFTDLILSCWEGDPEMRPSPLEILRTLTGILNKPYDLEIEVQRILPGPIDSRLGSHLRRNITPTVRQELPLCTAKLEGLRGTSRRLLEVDNKIWMATSTGHIIVLECESINNKFSIKQVQQVQAHDGRIAAMIMVQSKVWTCSDDDERIRIWNTNLELVHSFKPGAGGKSRGPGLLLFCEFPSPVVWCALPAQGQISVWNPVTYALEQTINDPQLVGMNSFIYFKQNIWIANKGIVLMYTSFFSFIGSFTAHETKAQTFIISFRDNIWTGSATEIKIWHAASIATLELVKLYVIGDSKIECMCASASRVFVGYFKGEIAMWDAEKLVPLQEVIPSSQSIKYICCDNEKLWAVSTKYELFLYNPNYLHKKHKVVMGRRLFTFKTTRLPRRLTAEDLDDENTTPVRNNELPVDDNINNDINDNNNNNHWNNGLNKDVDQDDENFSKKSIRIINEEKLNGEDNKRQTQIRSNDSPLNKSGRSTENNVKRVKKVNVQKPSLDKFKFDSVENFESHMEGITTELKTSNTDNSKKKSILTNKDKNSLRSSRSIDNIKKKTDKNIVNGSDNEKNSKKVKRSSVSSISSIRTEELVSSRDSTPVLSKRVAPNNKSSPLSSAHSTIRSAKQNNEILSNSPRGSSDNLLNNVNTMRGNSIKLFLVDPALQNLRNNLLQNINNIEETQVTNVQLVGVYNQLIANIQLNPELTVDSLYQSSIPLLLIQKGLYLQNLPFEILWYTSDENPVRFYENDLAQKIGPFLLRFPKLKYVPLTTKNLEEALTFEGIEIYGTLNPITNPSAIVLSHPGAVVIRE